MEAAQAAIEKKERGVIIWLDQEGKGNGHLALIQSIPFKKEFGQAEAYMSAGYKADARDYSAAAQILADLEIESVVVLANDPSKADELRGAGVAVTSVAPLTISANV
jgi:3,4-dihydroxy 2-butanone 4-phosphate synthase/GTP cyclohydrolase II